MHEAFNLLNKYQKDAVVSSERFLLLNAGVGSGKTTVLVNKVLYLYHVKRVPLSNMVVLTFTNKAAEEIRIRLISSAAEDISREDLSLFGTFHSVARNLLSSRLPVEDLGYTRDFTVLDQNGVDELIDSIINTHGLNIKYRKKLLKRLELYKDNRTLYGNMKQEDEIDRFIEIYKEEKLRRNVMDFDDLIENASRLLHRGYFKASWVIIDEFQDTDSSQIDMIEGIIGEDTCVFAVGDPNQVIYSWRGGSKDVFTLFKERYNAVEKNLPVNYRSSATIIQAAKSFLDDPTALEASRDKGTSIVIKRHYNSFNEAIYLADVIRKLHKEGTEYKDIAVFYRMQKQSAVFENVFKREGIPFEVSIRKNFKDIPVLYWFIKLLKIALNPRDKDSLLYVIKDERYGLHMSKKAASKLLSGKGGEDTFSGLIVKIKGFRDWAGGLEPGEDMAGRIYDYFDIDNYISPTSISYDDDKNIILKYIEEIRGFININNYSLLQGMERAMDYAALYGNGIINEIIHPEKESVKLMTLHASKGLEFKYVFISGANYGVMPLGSRIDDEEEKRLFFVGITRAKDYLEISYHSNPEDYKALPLPSPYIRMIPEELVESQELKSRAHSLSDLRKEVKSSMDERKEAAKEIRREVVHPKYGKGFVISEDDDTYTVEFETYGEKSFSKLFCPLKFL